MLVASRITNQVGLKMFSQPISQIFRLKHTDNSTSKTSQITTRTRDEIESLIGLSTINLSLCGIATVMGIAIDDTGILPVIFGAGVYINAYNIKHYRKDLKNIQK